MAESNRIDSQPREIVVGVSADGVYTINKQPVEGVGIEVLTNALAAAAQGDVSRTVIVSADAMAAHQSVINVMDAARRAGTGATDVRHPERPQRRQGPVSR